MRTFTITVLVLLFVSGIQVQAQPTPTTPTAVPRLVRISSTYNPANGSAPAGKQTIMLAIYGVETGGTALWQEV